MKEEKLDPASEMMSYGYDPKMASNSIKAPIYQTSTFCFSSAEEGERLFQIATGAAEGNMENQYIYSRLNSPNLHICEQRLCRWEKAEDAAIFESGMAAISTTLLSFLKPGDILLYAEPLYGGSEYFISQILTEMGVEIIPFNAAHQAKDLKTLLTAGQAERLKMIFIESPANPTNQMIDMAEIRRFVEDLHSPEKPLLAVDNTYLGPLWQHPLQLGADLVLYSATKYLGGHSDLIAGACLGRGELLSQVKRMRSYLGGAASPHTSWLLSRSLETLQIRMEKQAMNAQVVAQFLKEQAQIEKVYFADFLEKGSVQEGIFKRQCLSAGAMISFDIKGGRTEAFRFLNRLKLIKLAVSLGSTESLAQHPASMTHASMPVEKREQFGISDQLIRLSCGIEDAADIIADIRRALEN